MRPGWPSIMTFVHRVKRGQPLASVIGVHRASILPVAITVLKLRQD